MNVEANNKMKNNSNLNVPGHPVYEPERWNKNKYVRKSHNCYSYALNIIDDELAGRCKRIITKGNKTKKNKNNGKNNNGKNNKSNNNKKTKNNRNENQNNNNNKNKKKADCGTLKPQPGAYSKTIKGHGKYNCKKVTFRMIKDNPVMKPIDRGVPCPDNYYLIAMTCIPDGSDYHFYRQDASGLWSHKNGGNVARNTDDSGNLIHDPEFADRGRYTVFCGFYTVPNDSQFKRMSSRM